MSIRHLEEAKKLRAEGERLGRAGMSQYIIKKVKEFDGSYKGAMKLAGHLKAITIASKNNGYWDEMWRRGYDEALYDIRAFQPEEVEEEDK